MTKKYYYDDPYRREFEGVVLSCTPCKEGYLVELDGTAFYPAGGGQPGDTGTLGDTVVLDTHEREGRILHLCKDPLDVGSQVPGAIHWQRRFELMQQHSGEHLFSGLAHREYGLDNVGFHIGKEAVRVDLNGPLTLEEIQRVEHLTNQAIVENLPCTVTYPSPQELEQLAYRSKKALSGQVRIVNFGYADTCACCGTHVARTGEIGLVKVISAQPYKGGVRIFMQIGWQALADYEVRIQRIQALSQLLSAKPEDLTGAVEHLLHTSEETAQQLIAAKLKLFLAHLEQADLDQPMVVLFEEDLSPFDLCQCGKLLAQRVQAGAVLSGRDGTGYHYALVSEEQDMRPLCKALNEACSGRGGGKPHLVQGSLQGSRAEIAAFFQGAAFPLSDNR